MNFLEFVIVFLLHWNGISRPWFGSLLPPQDIADKSLYNSLNKPQMGKANPTQNDFSHRRCLGLEWTTIAAPLRCTFFLPSFSQLNPLFVLQFSWNPCYSSEKIAKPLDLMKVKNI